MEAVFQPNPGETFAKVANEVWQFTNMSIDCSFHCFRSWSFLPTGWQRTFLETARNVPRSSISAASGRNFTFLQRRISSKHQSFPRTWRETVKIYLPTLMVARLSKRRQQEVMEVSLRFVLSQSSPLSAFFWTFLNLKAFGQMPESVVLMTHQLLCF